MDLKLVAHGLKEIQKVGEVLIDTIEAELKARWDFFAVERESSTRLRLRFFGVELVARVELLFGTASGGRLGSLATYALNSKGEILVDKQVCFHGFDKSGHIYTNAYEGMIDDVEGAARAYAVLCAKGIQALGLTLAP